MSTIGYITTFSEFIEKYQVEIPRIQRDYTYGSKTTKTERVLGKLLRDIHHALSNAPDPQNDIELILDFVYGSNNDTFQPLDGQQRLTTLFLIYFFAAIKANIKIDKSFKYATRDDSTIFCEELLGLEYSDDKVSIVEQIKDSAFYRPSFNDDPSIRSILVVLEAIEKVFSDMVSNDEPKKLWDKLNKDCPVKFYCLDFGKFSLSDDLYIKMNSRGKQLTEYEIFKSQFEKYIEITLKDKDLKYKTARLFDNDFTDLIWDKQRRDKTKIDSGFVFLFKNLIVLLYHKYKNGNIDFDWSKPLYDNMSLLGITNDDINFIIDFLNEFRYVQKKVPSFFEEFCYKDEVSVLSDKTQPEKIRFFKSNVDVLTDACNSVLKNPQLVSLYAEYCAIKASKGKSEFILAFRHVRNLVEFSDDELGHAERIPAMLKEIDMIFDGNIQSIAAKDSKFNTTQFEEELEKEKHKDAWSKLFEYENHDILRGSLSLFAHPHEFSLSDKGKLDSLVERLQKICFVFDNEAKKNDQKIRACLLSIGDISQQHDMNCHSKMVGRKYGSWRLMFTSSNFFKSEGIRIMDVLDKVNKECPLSVSPLPTDDWRYYVTDEKYYPDTYVSYDAAKYGYYFFEDINKPLEMWLLQSTSSSKDNVMWKLMNNLLYENIPDGIEAKLWKYQIDHCVILNKRLSIDALQNGWYIEDRTKNMAIMTWLQKNTKIKDGVIPYTPSMDHIKEMVDIIDSLNKNGLFDTNSSNINREDIKAVYPGYEGIVDMLLDNDIEFNHNGDVDLLDNNDIVIASAGMLLKDYKIAIDPINLDSKIVFESAGYKVVSKEDFNINMVK